MAASVVEDSHRPLSFIDGVISDARQCYTASVDADCERFHTGQTISALATAPPHGFSPRSPWQIAPENGRKALYLNPVRIEAIIAWRTRMRSTSSPS
jgi:hypothetical protein